MCTECLCSFVGMLNLPYGCHDSLRPVIYVPIMAENISVRRCLGVISGTFEAFKTLSNNDNGRLAFALLDMMCW